MKKLIMSAAVSALTICMLWGSSVMAAPKKMSDGGIFDAQYYAAQNPDVVAAFGTRQGPLCW